MLISGVFTTFQRVGQHRGGHITAFELALSSFLGGGTRSPCHCTFRRGRHERGVIYCKSTMISVDKQRCHDVAHSAAMEAGKVIREAFDKHKHIELKGKVDLVTETDKKCEEIILAAIQSAFPDHKFIGEEGSAAQGFTSELTDEPTWMVDPVDGTTNFVHRFPFVCVSIGLAVGKEVAVGLVYNPILEECYSAIRGEGAYLNGEQLRVSEASELSNALVATELGVARDPATMDAIFQRIRALAEHTRSVRCTGSCALNLCSIARGRLDAYYEIGIGGPWDMAAGSLILEEAGGVVLDPAGGPFNLMARRVLGANGHLGPKVAAILAPCALGPSEPPIIVST